MKDYPKIDFHAHIYPAKIAEKAVKAIGDFYDTGMAKDGAPETLIGEGKKINVVKYVVHSVATTPAQVLSVNTFIANECGKHPEFIGFATLHPFSDELEEDIEQVRKLGLAGIKLHPDFQKFALDSPEAIRMFKLVAGEFPVLIHTGDVRFSYSNPVQMARALDAVPDLVAIGAHLGGYTVWEDARRLLLGRPNFFIDTSSTLWKMDAGTAADMIREQGISKTFFGTDFPMWDHEEEYARFMHMPLSDPERKAIFYDNAARFFGITE